MKITPLPLRLVSGKEALIDAKIHQKTGNWVGSSVSNACRQGALDQVRLALHELEIGPEDMLSIYWAYSPCWVCFSSDHRDTMHSILFFHVTWKNFIKYGKSFKLYSYK